MAAATATATAASFSTAVRRLVFPASLPSSAIRIRHFTAAARSRGMVSTPAPIRRIPLRRLSATASPATATTIAVGDKLPDATLSYFDSDGELKTITVSDLTKGKTTRRGEQKSPPWKRLFSPTLPLLPFAVHILLRPAPSLALRSWP